MTDDNRESWLNRVALGMAPLFDALEAPLPARARGSRSVWWSTPLREAPMIRPDGSTRISGEAFARGIGRAYANGDKAAFELMRKAGKPAEVFPAPALAELKQVLLPIERDWVEKAKKKGMADPQKVLDQLRADIAAAR